MGHRVTADWAWTTSIKTLSPIKSNEYDFLKETAAFTMLLTLNNIQLGFFFSLLLSVIDLFKKQNKTGGLGPLTFFSY